MMIAVNAVGRDSVLAQHRPPELKQASKKMMTKEELDVDLNKRLEKQFSLEEEPYNMAALRAAFKAKDKNKTGQIPRAEVRLFIKKNLINILVLLCSESRTNDTRIIFANIGITTLIFFCSF